VCNALRWALRWRDNATAAARLLTSLCTELRILTVRSSSVFRLKVRALGVENGDLLVLTVSAISQYQALCRKVLVSAWSASTAFVNSLSPRPFDTAHWTWLAMLPHTKSGASVWRYTASQYKSSLPAHLLWPSVITVTHGCKRNVFGSNKHGEANYLPRRSRHKTEGRNGRLGCHAQLPTLRLQQRFCRAHHRLGLICEGITLVLLCRSTANSSAIPDHRCGNDNRG
jgi:hypothetical protein